MTPDKNKSPNPSLPLPPSFLEFLEENGIDPSIYTIADTTPRYIRLKPGFESDVPEIEAELKCKLEKVMWLPCFYAIPPDIQIAGSKAYKSGKMYGMDAASGAAVVALDVSPGDHVLDLCAAPGAKLCMLSDVLGSSGSLTGVDVARDRLAACRTMLQKYALGDRCRLFVSDGMRFSLLPLRSHVDSKSCATDGNDLADIFTEWTSKRLWKDRKNASKARSNAIKAKSASGSCATSEPELMFYGSHSGVVGLCRKEVFHSVDSFDPSVTGYDKHPHSGWRVDTGHRVGSLYYLKYLHDPHYVLVDAECTHDGSIKHIRKFEYWGWTTLQHRVLDAERTDSLSHLQLGLLTNGFRLLKVGGSLVYSTCSLTVTQNEDVVEQFLSQNPSAELQEVDASANWCCRSGRIPGTLRFDPSTSQTSGLFVAKITKLVL